MASHVICHPAEAKFPPLPQPINLRPVLDSVTPDGCKAEFDLAGLVTVYQGGIHVRRRSPIPVLTGLRSGGVNGYNTLIA